MAKKYLLYIHTARFEKEKKKSTLVNRLLEEYYSADDSVAVGDVAVGNNGLVFGPPIPRPDIPYCQHDFPVTTCVNPACVKKARDKGLI